MADTRIQRRDLLKAAAGTAAAATATALGAPVRAQSNVPAVSATPLVRPADVVLTNGKIITVDRTFSIADSIAIAGDRIAAVGPREAMARG